MFPELLPFDEYETVGIAFKPTAASLCAKSAVFSSSTTSSPSSILYFKTGCATDEGRICSSLLLSTQKIISLRDTLPVVSAVLSSSKVISVTACESPAVSTIFAVSAFSSAESVFEYTVNVISVFSSVWLSLSSMILKETLLSLLLSASILIVSLSPSKDTSLFSPHIIVFPSNVTSEFIFKFVKSNSNDCSFLLSGIVAVNKIFPFVLPFIQFTFSSDAVTTVD